VVAGGSNETSFSLFSVTGKVCVPTVCEVVNPIGECLLFQKQHWALGWYTKQWDVRKNYQPPKDSIEFSGSSYVQALEAGYEVRVFPSEAFQRPPADVEHHFASDDYFRAERELQAMETSLSPSASPEDPFLNVEDPEVPVIPPGAGPGDEFRGMGWRYPGLMNRLVDEDRPRPRICVPEIPMSTRPPGEFCDCTSRSGLFTIAKLPSGGMGLFCDGCKKRSRPQKPEADDDEGSRWDHIV